MMRRSVGPFAPSKQPGTRLRGLALLLALSALLLNQALLPYLHAAAGGPVLAITKQPEQHHSGFGDAAGAVAHRSDGDKGPATSEHQVCHFCRLLGAALPLPPSAEIGRVPVAIRLAWSPGEAAPIAPVDFTAGHRVRAPPPLI
jgi:hypothetical protein